MFNAIAEEVRDAAGETPSQNSRVLCLWKVQARYCTNCMPCMLRAKEIVKHLQTMPLMSRPFILSVIRQVLSI